MGVYFTNTGPPFDRIGEATRVAARRAILADLPQRPRTLGLAMQE